MTFPDRQDVLDFLNANPDTTRRRDIARGLKLKGAERAQLREILKALEDEGVLERTAKRGYARADQPPATTIVSFVRVDEHGDLIGRALGREGAYGPELIYSGPAHTSGKRKPAGREPGVGDRGLCRLSEADGVWRARLIKLFDKHAGDPVVGLFTRSGRGGRIESSDRRHKRDFQVEAGDVNGAEDGDLVRAEPKSAHRQRPRFAVVREVVGRAGDPRAASLIALHAHAIPTEFPQQVLDEAANAEPAPTEREDLTAVPLITIDPEDARDHDDAVFAEKLDDGWRVIVAIADVAAFVEEGSALDREAWKRGNSTYFPDRVIPMLPFDLSAGECSLNEDALRRCFAVEMEFDSAGTKRGHRFIRAMMRSAAKLSYHDAQSAIDGKAQGRAADILETVLEPLWGAYRALSAARARRGPLDLDLPEKRIQFAEDGTVQAITVKERFDAHKLVEEFMIQANVAAAETLEKHKAPRIYRVHDQPSDAKLAALAEFLKTVNINWPLGERPRTARFNHLLSDAAGTDQQQMITEMVLRSQAQAVYAAENLGHFGLNLSRYAHFTSPIRRYSDLIVHRALISALDLGPDGLGDEAAARLEETASHLVETERRSMAAERDATDRYLALFLSDRVGADFEGRITGVTKAGLFVRLAETAADGFVPISTLSDEYWVFDEAAMRLVARGSGQRFELGQPVTARLKEVTPLQGGLLLEILSDPRPREKGAKPPAPGDHRTRGRKAAAKGGRKRRSDR